MKVLVCGGRHFAMRAEMYADMKKFALGQEERYSLIINGSASGADYLATQFAQLHGIPLALFPAPWLHHGKKAGVLRNGWMLEFGQPDHVLAYPGGRGTRDMMQRAISSGVPAWLRLPEKWG